MFSTLKKGEQYIEDKEGMLTGVEESSHRQDLNFDR